MKYAVITDDGYYVSVTWFKEKKEALEEYQKKKRKEEFPTLVKFVK
jgi:hypothetical protein